MSRERSLILATACGLALSGARLSSRCDQQSKLDPLTGLMAAEAIREVVQNYLAKGRVAVILLAADEMRRVNEEFGRKAGDRTFGSLAKLVAMEIGNEGVVGRYGGASLLVALPGFSNEGAVKVAERLRRRVRLAITAGPEGLAGPLTVSCGVAEASVGPPDPLLLEAERSLTSAVGAGGDVVVCGEIEASNA